MKMGFTHILYGHQNYPYLPLFSGGYGSVNINL